MSARILVVDDNEDSVMILTTLLERAGYVTGAAMDGVEALEKARKEQPDLILLDIMMPKLDGFEVLRTLKADPNMRDMPVLLVSAKADRHSKERAADLGAGDYLTKPIDGANLLRSIREHLGKQNPPSSSLKKTIRPFLLPGALAVKWWGSTGGGCFYAKPAEG
jgi:CheY-like chemotaxis protein